MSEVAHLTKLRSEDDEYEYFDTSIGYPARLTVGEASVGDAVMHVGGEDWVKIETRPNTFSEQMERMSELSLLIVDFGDLCVVKVEKGTMPQIPPYHRHLPSTFVLGVCFSELQQRIDAHFADNKPLPRIEPYPEKDPCAIRLVCDGDVEGCVLWNVHYTALNELARQVGATKDLPLYDPKGKWTQLGEDGPTDIPCSIWRYER